jgi:prolyl-tRNA synthetase
MIKKTCQGKNKIKELLTKTKLSIRFKIVLEFLNVIQELKRGGQNMRLSRMYLPTLKQVTTDSDYLSQEHMYRTGMIKKLYHGGFSYLPYGNRIYKELEMNLEECLEDYCTNEIYFPSILCNEGMKGNRYRFEYDTFVINSDRHLAIGLERDEVVVNQVKGMLTSYKKLPLTLFSKIKTAKKSKNLKESLVGALEQRYHEIYAFAPNEESLTEIMGEIVRNTQSILTDDCVWVKGDGDGLEYREDNALYMNIENGEENFITCEKCGYSCESSSLKPYTKAKVQDFEEKEEIYTPNVKTIEELESFLKIEGYRFVKSLIYSADGEYVMVELPGDQELDEYKLAKYLKISPNRLELAEAEVVREITGAEVGFAGPLNLKKEVRTLVDRSVTQMYNFVVGANKTDYHIKNVNYERDYEAEIVEDLLEVNSDSKCFKCEGQLNIKAGIKVLETRNYGQSFGELLDLNYLDENGKKRAMNYGVVRIYTESIIQGLLERAKQEDVFVLPEVLSPYDLSLILVNPKSDEQRELAENIYKTLKNENVRVIFDDRAERAGAKFKDAELMGMPYRLTVGRGAKDGVVEWIDSRKGVKEEIPYEKALNLIRNLDRA